MTRYTQDNPNICFCLCILSDLVFILDLSLFKVVVLLSATFSKLDWFGYTYTRTSVFSATVSSRACEVHVSVCARTGLKSERCTKPPGQQLVGSMEIVGIYRFTLHEVCTDRRQTVQRPRKSSQKASAAGLFVTY